MILTLFLVILETYRVGPHEYRLDRNDLLGPLIVFVSMDLLTLMKFLIEVSLA